MFCTGNGAKHGVVDSVRVDSARGCEKGSITGSQGVSGRSGSHPLRLVSMSYAFPPCCHGRSLDKDSADTHSPEIRSGCVHCPDIAIQPSRDLPQTPWSSQVLSSASKTISHSGTAEAFKTTFEVFPRVGPDNSLERLTERSVGLITQRSLVQIQPPQPFSRIPNPK